MRTLSCGIWDLVPWPGMELEPPALRAWNLGHWTTREVSCLLYFELLHLEFSLPCPLANSNREIGQWVLSEFLGCLQTAVARCPQPALQAAQRGLTSVAKLPW